MHHTLPQVLLSQALFAYRACSFNFSPFDSEPLAQTPLLILSWGLISDIRCRGPLCAGNIIYIVIHRAIPTLHVWYYSRVPPGGFRLNSPGQIPACCVLRPADSNGRYRGCTVCSSLRPHIRRPLSHHRRYNVCSAGTLWPCLCSAIWSARI